MKWSVTSRVISTSPPPAQLAQIAEKFCRLVSAFAQHEPADWLALVARELEPLDAAMKRMAGAADQDGYSLLEGIEQRHQMFVELKTFLGPMDDYWTDADLEVGDGVMTGSIADNITEIYFALNRGLALWSKGADKSSAVSEWVAGFETHWGGHLDNLRSQLKHKATLH